MQHKRLNKKIHRDAAPRLCFENRCCHFKTAEGKRIVFEINIKKGEHLQLHGDANISTGGAVDKSGKGVRVSEALVKEYMSLK